MDFTTMGIFTAVALQRGATVDELDDAFTYFRYNKVAFDCRQLVWQVDKAIARARNLQSGSNSGA